MADDVTDNTPTVTAPDPNDPNNPNNPNSIFNINNPANPNYVPPPMQVSQGMPDPNNPQPLQNTGTDANSLLGTPTSVLPLQNQTQADIQIKEQQDELFAAIARGDRVRVEELVDQGADVMRPDNSGVNAIMNAVAGNDSGISRDFLQQKANGNIGYDPLADVNLTGGMSLTDPLNPLNPLSALGIQPSTSDAQALGLTADEAAAMGDYSLAAQLAAEQSLDDEERAANEGDGSDPEFDGDMTYSASVLDDDDGDYGTNSYGNNSAYGGYGNNGYGNNADYYGDGYDGYGDPTYGDPSYDASAYGTPDGSTTGSPTTTNTDPLLGAIGDGLAVMGTVDALNYLNNSGALSTTTSPTSSNLYSSFLGALDATGSPTLSTDLGLLYGGTTTSPTSTTSTDPLLSSFFDFSSPTTNNTIWNTSFFDPSSLSSPTTTTSSPTVTAPSIPPTNPAYSAPSGP